MTTAQARERIRQMLAKRYRGAIEPTEEMINFVMERAMVHADLPSMSTASAVIKGTSAWDFPAGS